MSMKEPTSPTRVLHASLAFIEALAKHTDIATLETQQQRLLISLYLYGELSQQDLEKRTGVKRTANSRNIARLGKGERPKVLAGPGWVDSYDDEEDRRNKRVYLTPRGRQMLERCAMEVAHLFV